MFQYSPIGRPMFHNSLTSRLMFFLFTLLFSPCSKFRLKSSNIIYTILLNYFIITLFYYFDIIIAITAVIFFI